MSDFKKYTKAADACISPDMQGKPLKRIKFEVKLPDGTKEVLVVGTQVVIKESGKIGFVEWVDNRGILCNTIIGKNKAYQFDELKIGDHSPQWLVNSWIKNNLIATHTSRDEDD
jgi:hypothetical protein